MKKISVIVPVYNVEKYLDRCVQSIVDQTYSDLEIILVNDGSPDRCPQICDEWSRRDSRIKVIHQENKGISGARNAGISSAQGEYLYFVDSDDWICPTLCEKVMNIFENNDVDIVVFNCDQVTESGKSLGGTEKFKEKVLSKEEALTDLMQGYINNYAWNKIYKRAVFCNIWFPDGRVYEDMAVSYKLFLNSSRIYCLDEQLYFYIQRSGSLVSALNGKKLSDLFLSRWESYTYLKPLYPDIAELIFPRVALCAIRLYDRSLWECVNENVYKEAIAFLAENKEKILMREQAISYRIYYRFPWIYKKIRLGKHFAGNIVRAVRRRKSLWLDNN